MGTGLALAIEQAPQFVSAVTRRELWRKEATGKIVVDSRCTLAVGDIVILLDQRAGESCAAEIIKTKAGKFRLHIWRRSSLDTRDVVELDFRSC